MDADKWYSNVSLSHDRACTRLEFVNEWFFRADAAGALPSPCGLAIIIRSVVYAGVARRGYLRAFYR
jgi:hypothetical protein